MRDIGNAPMSRTIPPLDIFSSNDLPQADQSYQLRCRDKRGDYMLPFPCLYAGGAWINRDSGNPIRAQVVGWRQWPNSAVTLSPDDSGSGTRH